MSADAPMLLAKAQRALSTTQEGLGKLMGVSRRTAQRWATGITAPATFQLHDIARLVYPRDPEVARHIASATGTTLVGLGLETAPGVADAASTAQARLHGDSLVCAAAEALAVKPNAVRPALLATLARMRELGLTLETAEATLRAPRANAD